MKGRRSQPRTTPLGAGHAPIHEHVLAMLGLVMLVAVSYVPAVLYGGFIWDDVIITKASPIRDATGLWRIWFSPDDLKQWEGHYWPLLYTTFWLEHKLWGFAPIGYHFVNVLLHSVVVLLAWRLLLRLGVPGAWFAAAVFAVHPLHAESVAWIIGRKDVLATLFALACGFSYMRFVEDGRGARYFLALALFVAGLLSKSTIVTLPVAFVVWHWWKQERVARVDWIRILPFFTVGLFITVTDWWIYKGKEVISFDYSFPERVVIAARALWFYVTKLVWPVDLMTIYPRWPITVADPWGWTCVVAGTAVAVLLWHARGRIGRGPLAAVLFFTVALFPVLGFVDYGYMQFSFVADRYQYLAGLGVIALLVAAATTGLTRLGAFQGVPDGTLKGAFADVRRVGVGVVAVMVLVALGTLTWRQSEIYHDQGTFFTHILFLNPEARGAQHNLGDWLSNEGRHEEALAAYRIAHEQRPDFATIVNKMGVEYESLGQPEKAEAHYRRALRMDSRHVHAITNLALLLTKRKQHEEALTLYREVIRIDPRYVNAYVGMSVALGQMRRYAEALKMLEQALELEPDSPTARANYEYVNGLMGK